MSASYRFLGPGLAIIAGLAALTFLIPKFRKPEVQLQHYGNVPSFSLTERSGKTITNADLAGKIWIADFIFTTCPAPCPIISANMTKLQTELRGDPHVQQDNHGKTLEPGQFLVTHSTRMVLVDANGAMRGFYDGLGGDNNLSLLEAVRQLEREEF
jgi:cytochrome oxidase Cu insertion factor (SCO1/SenC/PrrC family)